MSKPENFPSEPRELWNHFYNFTQVPRPSKQEEKICEHVISIAKEFGYEYKTDKQKNIVIYVPATPGYENKDPLIIQNHVDMVTDALPSRKINFSEDPIKTYVDGDWLRAEGTTLGSDNGIGCAAALAVMTDKTVKHPALELLFTTDEEQGLGGAQGLEPNVFNFKATRMLNLDTEEWGSAYIGCAGGIDKQLNKKVDLVKAQAGFQTYKITVGGLLGGHSGLDIHKPLANAIKLLNEYLVEVNNSVDFELAELRGGKAHNIIPRDAYAYIRINSANESKLNEIGATLKKRWMSYLTADDKKNLHIELSEEADKTEVLAQSEKDNLLSFISLFPHGARNYLEHGDEPLVSVSNNFAQVLVMNGHVHAMASVRFFDREEARSFEQVFDGLAKAYGFDLSSNGEYPSWKPIWENGLLETVKEQYQKTFGQEAKIKAIHAGLECGILREHIGKIDAVSIGPTIMGAHSPDERVQISTVASFWKLLVNTVESL